MFIGRSPLSRRGRQDRPARAARPAARSRPQAEAIEPRILLSSTQTFSDSIPFQTTDFSRTVNLPQFDPTLGTLLTVEVTNEATLRSVYRFENEAPSPGSIIFRVNGTVTLAAPTGQVPSSLPTPIQLTLSDSRTEALAPYDGVTDFAGTSGRVVGPIDVGDRGSLQLVAGIDDLSPYVGTGLVQQVEATLVRSTAQEETGNVTSGVRTQVGATVSVVYTYEAFAALGDRVFVDTNANGLQDGGEPGVPGVTVTLLDAAGNPVLDSGGNPVTRTTDGDGLYLFDKLRPGTYAVRFDRPAGYAFTTADADGNGSDAIDSDADPATGRTATVTLAAGETNRTLDAGLIIPAELGDFVWEDRDGDGQQDAGEPGVPGVTATLTDASGSPVLDASGNPVPAQQTDGQGKYLFTNLRPGDYRVVFGGLPAGFVLTAANLGADATDSDADPMTGRTGTYTLSQGESNLTVDAGIYRPAALGDRVFVDTNANGLQDGGEPGVPGVTVTLLDAAGNPVLDSGGNPVTRATDDDGLYLFTGLTPGSYSVRFGAPAGFAFTTANVNSNGSDAIDSDADPGTGRTASVTLASGDTNRTLDAGLVSLLGRISGTKYRDLTGDGLSADDTGLGGTTIYIDTNNNGRLDTGERRTVTAADGSYEFTGLVADTYRIREVLTGNFIRTGPTTSDVYVVSLDAGQDASGFDFANFEACETCQKGRITNVSYLINGKTVVSDLRGNTNEGDLVEVIFTVTGGAPVTVTLVSYTAPSQSFSANNASQQRIYDLDTGTFGPGTYRLQVYNPDSYFQVDFVCGSAIETFGPAGSNIFYTPQKRLISADNDGTKRPVADPASLAGRVYVDANNNGVYDSGEAPIAGITVTLNGPGGKARTVLTKDDGTYFFGNLTAGTYSVAAAQSAAHDDGLESIGTVGGVIRGTLPSNDVIAQVALSAGDRGVSYNFGERLKTPGGVCEDQTATIGFWQNKNGQNLLKCVTDKKLGNWLADNFPKLFGCLKNRTGADVASYFKALFNSGGSPKAEAQVMATALNVYFSTSSLGGSKGVAFGFRPTAAGLGAAVINVGSNGAAFGLPNGATKTVFQLLQLANGKASSDGTLYSGWSQKALRGQLTAAFDSINNAAHI